MGKVRPASLIVRQGGIVHDLQEDVVDVRMGLFDFIQQKDGGGILAHRLGQQAAVLIAHIAGGGADQLGHGMLFRVFAHVKAQELDAQFPGQGAGDLGFAHAGGSDEEEAGQWLVF